MTATWTHGPTAAFIAAAILVPLLVSAEEAPSVQDVQDVDPVDSPIVDEVLDSISSLREGALGGDIDSVLEKLRAEFGRLRIGSDHALREMKAARDRPEVVEEMSEKHRALSRRAKETHDLITIIQSLRQPADEELLGIPPADGIPREDVDALAEWVDLVFERIWALRGITPAPIIPDEAFLRRASIDIAGRAPGPAERESFLRSSLETRRAEVIDALVESRGYAENFANYWYVHVIGRGYLIDDKHGEPFLDWLKKSFAANMRHDEFATALITNTKTNTEQVSPTLFLAARQSDAIANINEITNTFLGLRMQCAQCHDDPYQPWTQDDFHSMAAFLVRQREKGLPGNVYELVDRDKGEAAYLTPDGQNRTASMRYYTGRTFSDFVVDESDAKKPDPETRRQKLARMLVEDPQFARAQVNRIWSNLFGRGLVQPVENFTSDNPPTVPLVLDALSRKFAESGFDSRWLIRVLARTRAYRVGPGAAEGASPTRIAEAFARYPFKALTAEQIVDSILAVTGYDAIVQKEGVVKAKGRAGRLPNYHPRVREFIDAYAWEPEKVTDPNQGTIPQTLALLNGRLVSEACSNREGLIVAGALSSDLDTLVDVVYEAVLCREPTESERRKVDAFLRASPDRSVAASDLVWTLINSAEFRYNH